MVTRSWPCLKANGQAQCHSLCLPACGSGFKLLGQPTWHHGSHHYRNGIISFIYCFSILYLLNFHSNLLDCIVFACLLSSFPSVLRGKVRLLSWHLLKNVYVLSFYAWACVYRWSNSSEEGIISFKDRVADGCELLDMGCRDQTKVLYKTSKWWDVSLAPFPFVCNS